MKADRRSKEYVLTALGFEVLAVVLATIAVFVPGVNHTLEDLVTITSAAGLVFAGAAGGRLEMINRG